MAADTAVVRMLAQYFSGGVTSPPPLANFAPPDWSVPAPSQVTGPRRLLVPVAGVTVRFDGWNTVLALLIANRDPVNYVEVAYTYPSPTGGAKANVLPLQPAANTVINGPMTVANGLLFTAFGGTVTVDYAIIGT